MNLSAIADEMKSAQDMCRQVEPFTARVSGFDTAAAYEVGRLIHEARVHEGAVPVGRKIGFTNRDMWYEHGVYEPIWALCTIRLLFVCPGLERHVASDDLPNRGSSRRSSYTSDQRQS